MSAVVAVVALVAATRLGELLLARRNGRRLIAAGGIEHGAGHYPLFVALHAGWLAALVLLVPADAAVRWVWLAVYVALLAAKAWVIISLGGSWTTRVISVTGTPLVRRGPYRWLRHPNYLIVCAEIAVLPLVFGAWALSLAFGAANLLLVGYRIRVEDAALADRRRNAGST